MTFDGTSREACTLRRIRTNTPLQAFVTLNDPVFVECAQALARRIVREGGSTPEERAARGVWLTRCEAPREEELGVLVALFEAERAHFARAPRGGAAFGDGSVGAAAGRDGRRGARRLDGGRERAAQPGRVPQQGLIR